MSTTSGSSSPLARFPAEVQEAFARFQTDREVADLERVIHAALLDYMPKRVGGLPLAALQPDQRLVEDLGFDSLTVAEIIFFFEDLLGISIQNQEIQVLGTVGELQAFVARKLAEPRGAA